MTTLVTPEVRTLQAAPPGASSPLWRQAAVARAERVVQALNDPQREPLRAREAEFAETEVRGRATTAAQLATGSSRSLRDWWSGGDVESCWRELRLAEEGLVYLAAPHQLPSLAQDALNHANAYLPAGDKRVDQLKQAARQPNAVDGLRASIVSVLAAGHEASDQAHRDMRGYQNLLRLLTIALGLLAALAAVAAVTWLRVPLFTPPDGIGAGWAVVCAFAAGAMGALFSAIPSLAQIPPSGAPFNPVREQAGLKIAVGAWSAIVGLLVVTAGLATSDVDPSASPAGLLIIAALFGANQEALTRFADHKAATLRSATSP
jgi:hypothetical protein